MKMSFGSVMGAAVGLAGLVAGVAQASTAGKPAQKINVCYQDFREEMVTAALLVAEKNKFFAEEGLQIRWIKSPKMSKFAQDQVLKVSNLNAKAEPAYLNGVIEEAAVLQNAEKEKCHFVSTTVEAAFGAGVDLSLYVPVANYRYGKDYDVPVVVRADSEIKSVADLKGKTVRVNQVGSVLPFEDMLKSAGLSSKDVKYQKVALNSVHTALDQKQVDVVLSYNPTIPLLMGSNRVRVLEGNLFAKHYPGGYVPHSLLLMSKSRTEAQVQEKFMRAFERGSQQLTQKPGTLVEAFPFLKKNYSNVEIERSLNFTKIGPAVIRKSSNAATYMQDSRFAEYANLLQERGFLTSKVDLSSWQNVQ
ncbi:MAG TPA: ABC transporter substrate-binding protein [Pseudobdellovibrionaceae bacterium]|nr:ABC transporter substrate-binding protein [Pseudobdellovibrionaceae bacterium]